MSSLAERVLATMRDVPDFPKPGIIFKDITPVLADGPLFQEITEHFASQLGPNVDQIVGIESRGFIFGAALSQMTGIGLTLVRKPGKLPYKTFEISYELEYGTDSLQMHVDAIGKDSNVVILDDVLATGGTASATVSLVEKAGAHVETCLFLMELGFLNGRQKIAPSVRSLIVL